MNHILFILLACITLCACKKSDSPAARADNATFFKVFENISWSDRWFSGVLHISSDAAGNLYTLSVKDYYAEGYGMNIVKTDNRGNFIQTKSVPYYLSYYVPASGTGNYNVAFDGSGFYFIGVDSLSDYYFLKIDTAGNTIFKISTNSFIPPGSNAASNHCFVYLTSENNIIIGGSVYDWDFSYSYPFLLSYSPGGDLLWKHFYQDSIHIGQAFTMAEETAGGGYLLTAGYIYDVGCVLYRLNSNGEILWQKNMSSSLYLKGLARISDDHYMLIAHNYYNQQSKVIAIDSLGNQRDSVTLTAPFDNYQPVGFMRKPGDKLLTILNNIYDPFGSDYSAVSRSVVFDINSSYSVNSMKQFGQVGTDITISSVTLTHDNHLAFTGVIRNLSTFYLFILKTDLNGNY